MSKLFLSFIYSGTKNADISQLKITEPGVEKLLGKLNPRKASGPDNIPNLILKELSAELAPIISAIFNQSLATGTLPKDWTDANVTPIYKKSNKHDPANYRPVSLTCVCCKLLEHIICRHMMAHFENFDILTNLQHGFRSGHSCESQLLITTDDLFKNFDNKIQTDIAILDFSKAFDTVPHKRLLTKLSHYGVNGNINKWIESFLGNRNQSVVVEGVKSSPVRVLSGVPQGTVLGPILFLCHINDLPSTVTSQVRMFADDCLVYRTITAEQDHLLLQKDLEALDCWANMWGMIFNPTKCYIMRNSRSRTPSTYTYTLCNHPLEQVTENPYLGVLLSENFKWAKNILKTTKKANKVLGFLRRNLHMCNRTVKETAVKALVRPILEYSCTVWDPYLRGDIDALEAVQRRAARFVLKDYGRESSVTNMLRELKWPPLSDRRRDSRLVLYYKILNNLIAIPYSDYLTLKTSRTRNRHSRQYSVLSPKTEIYRNSFFPRTTLDWNGLTENQISATTVDLFKDRTINQQYK